MYKALFKEKKVSAPGFVHLKQAYSKELVIDQCMVTFFRGPKSYTGENMLEISTHGGTVIAQKIIQLIESNKFRPAHPGEFTYRAFVNGKLDLAQAESVQTIIDSRNSLDSLYSIKNVQGHFSNQVSSMKSKIKKILSYMEHEMDFSEDEIDFETHTNYMKNIKKVASSIASLLEKSYLTKQNKSSVVIALAGKTNVGKSSLFNKDFLVNDVSLLVNITHFLACLCIHKEVIHRLGQNRCRSTGMAKFAEQYNCSAA